MKPENLKKAVQLGQRMQMVLVTTADGKGLPHLAAAGGIRLQPDGNVTVTAWFCPATVANLHDNPLLSLVVWEPATDSGYQLLGHMEKMQETAMLNGFSDDSAAAEPLPQVERELVVRIDRILAFSLAPHSDAEE